MVKITQIILTIFVLSVCVNASWYDLFARRLKGKRRSRQFELFNTTNEEEIQNFNTVSF